jgi:hypothetical protein
MREEYPLPKSRQEVISAVGRILNLGGVQQLVIKLGEPIKVYRAVLANGDVPTTLDELESQDLYDQVRNSPMESFEFKVKDQSGYEVIFLAFKRITNDRLVARSFIVSNVKMLRAWLGLMAMEDVETLYGVPCVVHADIPEDVLLLVATSLDKPEGVELTMRLEMA